MASMQFQVQRAIVALLVAYGTFPACAVEIAGGLLIELDAAAFETGALIWPQKTKRTGISGHFVPHGSPTRERVAGAPAVVFDGDGDYFVGPETTALLHAPNAPHSVEFWAYQGNIRDQESVVSWGRRWGPDGTFAGFRYGADPEFGAVSRWGVADTGFTTVPPPGRWHHLAYTYDGTTQHCYVDGALDHSKKLAKIDPHNSLPIHLGTELRGDSTIEGRLAHFSGALGRLRIHRGALSPETVLRIHRDESPVFRGAEPQPLRRLPLHRFSFGGTEAAAPDGTVTIDRIGGLRAVVRGRGARVTGQGHALPGGGSAIAAYIDLPNGLISSHEAVSIEFWATQSAHVDWARILSFGTCSAGEVTGPGGEFTSDEVLSLVGNVGSAHVHRFTRSGGTYPNGGHDRDTAAYSDADYGTEFHHVIRYDPSLQHWHWFRNGVLMESIPDREGPTGIEDINVWLGRSEFSDDNNLSATFHECRIYSYPLSEEEIRGSLLAGPDKIEIANQPKSLQWGVRGPGTFNYRNPPGGDQWNTGDHGPHPDGPGETAYISGCAGGRQDITLDIPVTLGSLGLGPAGEVRLLAGPNGSLTMNAGSVGPAAITLSPGSPGFRLDAPLHLAHDTEIINLSEHTLEINAPLSGPGRLIKTGGGPLLITGDCSTHTGGIKILNGDLVFGGHGADSPFMPRTEIVHPGRIVVNRDNKTTISAVCDGTGSFIHQGIGALILGPGARLSGSGIIESTPGAGPLVQDGLIDGAASFFINNEVVLRGESITRLHGWLAVGHGSGGILRVQDSATLEVLDIGHLNVGDIGPGHSAMFVEDGVVRFKELHIGKHQDCSGVLIQNGGRLDKMPGGGESRVGGSSQGAHQSSGAWHLNGGSFTADWNLQIGAYGIGVMVLDGGSAKIDGFMAIGRFMDDQGRAGQGVVDLKAGQLEVSGPERLLHVGEEGIGELSVRGAGILRCANSIVIGAGTVDRAGRGIVNLLDDGLLVTGGIEQFNKANASGILNLDGGTLRANRANPDFITDLDAIWIRPGGARIDTNGFDIGITLPLTTPEGAGVVSIPVVSGGSGYVGTPMVRVQGGGDHSATAVAELRNGSVARVLITNPGAGFRSPPVIKILGEGDGSGFVPGTPVLATNTGGGLTKIGAGTLRLDAACHFPGPINVAGGTLKINGDFTEATGMVTVNEEATLGGSGIVGGDVLVKAGATLAPGSPVGAFHTIEGLTLEGNLVIEAEGANVDHIKVGRRLTLQKARLTLDPGFTAPQRRTRIIATYATLEGTFENHQDLPAGFHLDYQYNGLNQIALVFTAEDADDR